MKPQYEPQKSGAEEFQRLRLKRVFHQPSSRRKKLPSLGAAS